jgi:hypothetical protein
MRIKLTDNEKNVLKKISDNISLEITADNEIEIDDDLLEELLDLCGEYEVEKVQGNEFDEEYDLIAGLVTKLSNLIS